jgi:hypothetical protein
LNADLGLNSSSFPRRSGRTKPTQVVDNNGGGDGVETDFGLPYYNILRCIDSVSLCPHSLYDTLKFMSRACSGNPLFRTRAWLLKQRRVANVASTVSPPADGHSAAEDFYKLLPTHLPVSPVDAQMPACKRTRRLWYARRSAWEITEWLVSAFNFYELCCPKHPRQLAERLGTWSVSVDQERAIQQLFHQVLSFCRGSSKTDWSRGRKTLFEAIEHIERVGNIGSFCDVTNVDAREVDPERISVPSAAAIILPQDHISPERARVLNDLTKIVIEDEFLPETIEDSCHWITKENETRLRSRLLECGMAEVVLASLVPRSPEGKRLVAGLFAVTHKSTSDRLIIDRRALNSTEKRLCWEGLPHGALFAQVRLGPKDHIRASGDDLSNYFYLLENPENWRHRTCVGRPFFGKDLPDSGLPPDEKYFLSLRVWAMGDKNSVDVAQATHKGVLQHAHCMEPQHELLFGVPTPSTRILEGIYIDDHIVAGVVRKHEVGEKAGMPDWAIVERSRAEYHRLGLPRAEAKAFEIQRSFVAWGTEVDSSSGRCGTPEEKRRQLFFLTCLTISSNRVTKKLMQSLMGSFIHPFMHRRECMCIFGRAFQWVHGLPEKEVVGIPHDIQDELWVACLHLTIACADIRAPICTNVTCSDATPTTIGTVQSTVSSDCASALYTHGEHKGAYTRMDWSSLNWELEEWREHELPRELAHVHDGIPWKVIDEIELKTTEHVNIQELRGSKRVLMYHCRRNLDSERVVNGVDSRVVLGAYAKGRSSSKHLNNVLRQCLGWGVLGNKRMVQYWLPSNRNPADAPSRGVALKRPVDLSEKLKRLVRPTRTPSRHGSRALDAVGLLCLEVFSGAGGLTRSMLDRHIPMDVPMEAFPNRHTYIRDHDLRLPCVVQRLLEDINHGCYKYLHFGMPCSSFSQIQRLNSGTRTKERPEGDGSRPNEEEGNLLAEGVVLLCEALVGKGGFYSIENPLSSRFWELECLRGLMAEHCCVVFDQCEYGLTPPGIMISAGVRIKKSTKLLTNMKELCVLNRSCLGSHEHFRCLGSVRVGNKSVSVARAAGHYPVSLCTAWATAAASALLK